MNPISIIVGTGFFLGVSAGLDKFVFKREFDAKQTLINGVTVAIALGLAVFLSRKVGQTGKPLPTVVSEKIANK